MGTPLLARAFEGPTAFSRALVALTTVHSSQTIFLAVAAVALLLG